MNNFHICNTKSKSGIAKYAIDFQERVLGPLGYKLIEPRELTSNYIYQQPPEVRWHVQLGASQFEERHALTLLLKAGLGKVDVTLHDPPFLTFPYFPFRSPIFSKISRGFDWYFKSFGIQTRVLRRINKIYVLTDKGRAAVLNKGALEVIRIPHIVTPNSIWNFEVHNTNDILYFGFIGPTKGLEYALQLHESIKKVSPTTMMHVVGGAESALQKTFLASLQSRFTENVIYHGYVPEDGLDEVFRQVRHVFLPFQKYKYFHPISGSIINGLKRGRVVWSTPVNSVSELIKDGVNGLLFTGNIETDCAKFLDISSDTSICEHISNEALNTARLMSVYPYAQHFL